MVTFGGDMSAVLTSFKHRIKCPDCEEVYEKISRRRIPVVSRCEACSRLDGNKRSQNRWIKLRKAHKNRSHHNSIS